jgi:hypothetical protein
MNASADLQLALASSTCGFKQVDMLPNVAWGQNCLEPEPRKGSMTIPPRFVRSSGASSSIVVGFTVLRIAYRSPSRNWLRATRVIANLSVPALLRR